MKESKLIEAKELLKALGVEKPQRNDRSAWVLLALANISPHNDWSEAQNQLLPTVEIMGFIREHYFDYKPNSRETIRRQTLHQFEQARIVDRNRDDPARPTNSKDNNYSLTERIVAVLREYPDGDWLQRTVEFREEQEALKEQYQRRLDRDRIPVQFSDGKEFRLSPGRHNQLHADIAHEFCPRFIGGSGKVLYLGDTASSRKEGGKLMHLEIQQLASLGVPPMWHDKLPDMVVYDEDREWLFLIEAVTSHGPVSRKRWTELEEAMKDCIVDRVYVTAFPTISDFRKHAAEIAWETEVWIAEDPDHMIHYNGDRFLGPHEHARAKPD